MDIDSAVADLDRQLRAAGSEVRASHERQYLKSDLEFYGVSVPTIKATVGSWLAGLGDLTRSDLCALAEGLWSHEVHELRSAAVRLLEVRGELLEPSDIDLIERLIRESKTWALVDNLAASVAGPLLDRHPDADKVLDRWAADGDFWIRRSSLLAHLLPLRAGGGNFERFARHADAMLEEKEFFIRKVIGWVLRDTARKRPDLVYEWILPRAERASGVTLKEVLKRLSPDQVASIRGPQP